MAPSLKRNGLEVVLLRKAQVLHSGRIRISDQAGIVNEEHPNSTRVKNVAGAMLHTLHMIAYPLLYLSDHFLSFLDGWKDILLFSFQVFPFAQNSC